MPRISLDPAIRQQRRTWETTIRKHNKLFKKEADGILSILPRHREQMVLEKRNSLESLRLLRPFETMLVTKEEVSAIKKIRGRRITPEILVRIQQHNLDPR